MTSFNSTHKSLPPPRHLALPRCQGGTAKAVISCCDMLTKAQRPLWMIQTRSSCNEVVVCGGPQNSARGCYVRVTIKVDDGGDGGDEGGGDPGRGPNTPR